MKNMKNLPIMIYGLSFLIICALLWLRHIRGINGSELDFALVGLFILYPLSGLLCGISQGLQAHGRRWLWLALFGALWVLAGIGISGGLLSPELTAAACAAAIMLMALAMALTAALRKRI